MPTKDIQMACKLCLDNILEDLKNLAKQYPHLAEVGKAKVIEVANERILYRVLYEYDITYAEWTSEDDKSGPMPSSGRKSIYGPNAITLYLSFLFNEQPIPSTKDFDLKDLSPGLKFRVGLRPGKGETSPVGKAILKIVEQRIDELRQKLKPKS